MQTTPCGLLKFNPTDSYNFSDAVSNFDRVDKLLAQVGSHESRFFAYGGVESLGKLGITVDSRFTVTDFTLTGLGEWFRVVVRFTVKNTISRSGSKVVLNMPSAYAAMHTQKLGNISSGRGARGWISQAGAIVLGTTSGVDANLVAGEVLQLSGWYLPKNELRTIGVPTLGEKAPFYSSYNEMLSIVDDSCKKANTNLEHRGYGSIPISGYYAKYDGETFFTLNSDQFKTLNRVRIAKKNEFVYVDIYATTRNAVSIATNGTVDLAMGVINPLHLRPLNASPLESGVSGRLTYSYCLDTGHIALSAIGQAGRNGTLPAGSPISITGYYRIVGS